MVYRKVNNKSIVGILLFLLFSITTNAQTAVAIFQNKNDSFQISINNIKQHEGYANNVKINQLNGDRPYNVKIEFQNDSTIIKKNIYLIDNGLTHIYHITKEVIQLKKVVPAASYIGTDKQLTITYIENTTIPIDTITKDTAETIDTTYVVPFATYYRLENYEGKIGCPFPIKPQEQGELRGIIMAENLEESKLEKVKLAIQDMDSACVLVSQVKELIVLFQFEETRLDFAIFMYKYTFDIDNYEKLYAAFNFENSKDELKELIGKD